MINTHPVTGEWFPELLVFRVRRSSELLFEKQSCESKSALWMHAHRSWNRIKLKEDSTWLPVLEFVPCKFRRTCQYTICVTKLQCYVNYDVTQACFFLRLFGPFFFSFLTKFLWRTAFRFEALKATFFFFSLFNFLLLFLEHLSASCSSQHVRLSIKSSDKLYEIFYQLMFKLIIINLKLIKIHSNHFPFLATLQVH